MKGSSLKNIRCWVTIKYVSLLQVIGTSKKETDWNYLAKLLKIAFFLSIIRNVLSNSSFFHQKSSFVLIYCEIEQNSTGRKTDILVLGIKQSNHELVYWIVKK